MGMMSPAEKKKHAKKMKTLSKDLNKINNAWPQNQHFLKKIETQTRNITDRTL